MNSQKPNTYTQQHRHHNSHHSSHKKDDADRFRETSLRAIRRRKQLPKILFWILATITAVAVAAAFMVYHLD